MSNPTLDEACALIERQKAKIIQLDREIRHWRDREVPRLTAVVSSVERVIAETIDSGYDYNRFRALQDIKRILAAEHSKEPTP